MGWDLFHFGQIYQEEIPQHVPKNPTARGDYPTHFPNAPISIFDENDDVITWIKPSGMNIFVADRTLVRFISWNELNSCGFVDGKKIQINGRRFICRLPRTVIKTDGHNEWDSILKATTEDNALWHWQLMLFWESDIPDSLFNRRIKEKAVRGALSAQFTNAYAPSTVDTGIGFRPVLEPLGFELPVPNYELEGHQFQFNAICDRTNLLPTLQPVEKDVFANFPDGHKIRMYTFLEDGKPVLIDAHEKHGLKEKRQLELTDRYYGDEYLVPWTISNGIAISDKSFSLAT